MPVSADTMLDLMERMHRDRYASDPATLSPMALFFDADGAVNNITVIPQAGDQDHAAETLAALVTTMVASKSFGYLFSTEGWMKYATVKEFNDPSYVRPRDSERRIEVLIVEVHSFAEDGMRTYEIMRSDDGSVSDLRAMDMGGAESYTRFNIFPRAKTFEEVLNPTKTH